jgi:hypothetical protein
VYPGERDAVPAWILTELTQRLQAETRTPPPASRLCRGTLLSRGQYLTDIGAWDYLDARLQPFGAMRPEDVERWTAAIAEDGGDATSCRR